MFVVITFPLSLVPLINRSSCWEEGIDRVHRSMEIGLVSLEVRGARRWIENNASCFASFFFE